MFFNHDTRRIEGEGKVLLGTWSPQVWYKVKVVLDRRTNLYSVWIDERLAGQNIRTEGDCYQINALALFSGHPGVKVWYDDVRVFTVDPSVFEREYWVRVTYATWEVPTLFADPPVADMVILAGSPTGRPGETFTLAWLPGKLGWDTDWPRPAAGHAFRIWVAPVEAWGPRDAVIRWERFSTDPSAREYQVRVIEASWEDPTRFVDPPVAKMVILSGSPNGQPGETLNLAWLPGKLNWDTDWPRPAAEHAFRIWVAPTQFWGRTVDAVVRWERITAHFVSAPDVPTRPSEGAVGEVLSFWYGGAHCSQGHRIQIQFDWGDGTFSDWIRIPVPATHAWTTAGVYQVRTRARCDFDNTVVSAWSAPKAVAIRSGATAAIVSTDKRQYALGETIVFTVSTTVLCSATVRVEKPDGSTTTQVLGTLQPGQTVKFSGLAGLPLGSRTVLLYCGGSLVAQTAFTVVGTSFPTPPFPGLEGSDFVTGSITISPSGSRASSLGSRFSITVSGFPGGIQAVKIAERNPAGMWTVATLLGWLGTATVEWLADMQGVYEIIAWVDLNGNGLVDPGELSVPWLTVTVP